MNVKKAPGLLLSLTLLLLFFSLTGCSSKAKKAEVAREDAIAIVNDVGISKAQWQLSFDALMKRYESMGMPLDPVQTDSLKNQVLTSMITTELMFQKSVKEGFSFSEEDVTTEMEKIKSGYPTEELFKVAMEQQGVSEEMFITQIERSLTINNFVEEEIRSKQVVTEEEMREYYTETPNLWEQEEEVGARHILIKTTKDDPPDTLKSKRAKIDALLAKIKNGEDFETLAKEHSEDQSAADGGDLGYRTQGRMGPAFEDVAFSMKAGEISDVVETQFGYHIIQVYGKKEARTKPFEEVHDFIETDFLQRHTNSALFELIDELKTNGSIERLL